MTAVLYRVRAVLRSRWKSTLAATMVVALTGGLALTLVAGAARTMNSPDRYVNWLGLNFDSTVTQSEGLPRTDEIRNLPSVVSVESVTFVFGGLGPATVGASVPPDALVFAGAPSAIGGRIVEGREADPSNPGEFVATQSFVTASNARVGDTYVLQTITKDQAAASGFDVSVPEGPTIPATLVGVFGKLASLDDNPMVVFPYSLVDSGDIGVSATLSAVTLAPEATTGELRSQLDALPSGDIFSISPLEVVPGPVRTAVETQAFGLAILAVIVSVAGVIVAAQVLGREVRISERQGSSLRALGMIPRQLTFESLGRAGVPVVSGVLIGAVGAVAVSSLFPAGFARQIEPHPGVRFDPLVHLGGPMVLVAALMGWLAFSLLRRERRSEGAVAAQRSGRIAPWMRPAQAATAMRFTFSDHPRDSGSPRAQTAGLAVVLVVAIAAMTFGANMARLLDNPARYGGSDLVIGAGGQEISPQVLDQLAADSDIETLTLYGTVVVSVGSESLGVVGSQAVVGATAPTLLAGRLPTTSNEIALGTVAAHRLGAGIDDDFAVGAASGPETLRVTGLAVIPGVEEVDGIGDGGFVTFAGLQRLSSTAGFSSAGIDLRPGATANTAERLATLTGVSVGPANPPPDILNLGRVRSLPGLLVIVTVMLTVLSLAHLLVQSARQRRQDMAILRALGATRGWVSQVVHWQATIITSLVCVVALPLGFIVGRAAYRVIADRIGVPTDVFPPLVSFGVLLTALLVFTNVAAAVPSWRVRSQPPADYLNRE